MLAFNMFPAPDPNRAPGGREAIAEPAPQD
jgi:hypothetical protein